MEGGGAEATNQVKIKVTGVSMVAPAQPLQTHRMFLSNLDLLMIHFNRVPSVLFYKVSPESEYSSMVQRLKNTLSSVLVHFYPLAGRFVEGESGRLEVDCNNEGVEFIEASANIPFEDLERGGFQHKPYFTNLAPSANPVKNGNYSTPVLSIQVTSFKGGSGICLGTSVSHAIVDGRSYWHFMKSWGEFNKGLLLSNLPLHNRELLKVENRRNLLPLSFRPHAISNDTHILKFMPDISQNKFVKEGNFDESNQTKESIAQWQHRNQPLKYSTFHFTQEEIQQLKQRTKASSSYTALAAHCWRSVVKAREIPEEELIHFVLFVDCRARITPPLPPTYFGNCVSMCVCRTTAKRLLTEDASFAVQLLQETIASCTQEEQIRNTIEWLQSPGNDFTTIHQELGCGYNSGVGGSMSSQVSQVDYGWGNPLNWQLVGMTEVGWFNLAGRRSREFGVEAATCLPWNMMEKLSQIISPSPAFIKCNL